MEETRLLLGSDFMITWKIKVVRPVMPTIVAKLDRLLIRKIHFLKHNMQCGVRLAEENCPYHHPKNVDNLSGIKEGLSLNIVVL